MTKKRTSIESIVGESSISKRKKKLENIDKVESGNSSGEKKRAMFYLSLNAIDALEEIVFLRRRKVDREERSSVNKSTVVEQMIMETKKSNG